MRSLVIALMLTVLVAAGWWVRPQTGEPAPAPACVRTRRVQPITFSATRFPHIKRHAERAIARGWPSVLVLMRPGAGSRRARLLRGRPTRRGEDRDEYPPAVGRGRWRADVAYVPSSENRSHGSALGVKLRRFCDGTRFRYVFY